LEVGKTGVNWRHEGKYQLRGGGGKVEGKTFDPSLMWGKLKRSQTRRNRTLSRGAELVKQGALQESMPEGGEIGLLKKWKPASPVKIEFWEGALHSKGDESKPSKDPPQRTGWPAPP